MPYPICGDSCGLAPPTTEDFRTDPGWISWGASACLGGPAGILPWEDFCITAPSIGPLFLVDIDLGVGALGGNPWVGLPWDSVTDPFFSFQTEVGFAPWVIYNAAGPGPWTLTITVTRQPPDTPLVYQDVTEVRV